MIRVVGLHHVAVAVTDLARSLAFYRDLLGLTPIERPPFDFEGAWFALGDRQLHLIVHPEARALRRTSAVDGRDNHFALRVADFDETVEHLRARGVPLLLSRQNVTPWAQVFIADPDGNVIELNARREA